MVILNMALTIGNRAYSGKGANAIAIGLMAKTSNEKRVEIAKLL